jgi:O-antigen ligase
VPKNQIAPVFGTAFVAAIYFIFNNAQKKGSQMIYYITAFLLFASLLVIRGRSVILSVFVSIIVFVFFYLKQRKYKYVLIFSAIIIASLAGNFIYDALFLNYDITDIESISTGRMSRNYEGFDFFISNPLMGQLSGIKYPGFTIHNYILYNLVNYGLFVGGLIFLLYFKYIREIVKAFKTNSFRYYDLGPLLMTL